MLANSKHLVITDFLGQCDYLKMSDIIEHVDNENKWNMWHGLKNERTIEKYDASKYKELQNKLWGLDVEDGFRFIFKTVNVYGSGPGEYRRLGGEKMDELEYTNPEDNSDPTEIFRNTLSTAIKEITNRGNTICSMTIHELLPGDSIPPHSDTHPDEFRKHDVINFTYTCCIDHIPIPMHSGGGIGFSTFPKTKDQPIISLVYPYMPNTLTLIDCFTWTDRVFQFVPVLNPFIDTDVNRRIVFQGTIVLEKDVDIYNENWYDYKSKVEQPELKLAT